MEFFCRSTFFDPSDLNLVGAMFAVPAIIAYPVGVFGIAVGAAAYLWYRQPAFAVKYLMK